MIKNRNICHCLWNRASASMRSSLIRGHFELMNAKQIYQDDGSVSNWRWKTSCALRLASKYHSYKLACVNFNGSQRKSQLPSPTTEMAFSTTYLPTSSFCCKLMAITFPVSLTSTPSHSVSDSFDPHFRFRFHVGPLVATNNSSKHCLWGPFVVFLFFTAAGWWKN